MSTATPEREHAVEQLARWRNSVGNFAFELFGFVPDEWQRQAFEAWDRGDQRIALQACKGPGKTAVLAIFIWHFLVTREHPKIACTSITGDNLDDCLWPELSKWQQKSPFLLRIFEWTKTRVTCRDHPETWWASARTWSRTANAETQGQTLAGLHADFMLFILDETGGMPEAIMAAAEAALSTGIECRIVQAGNPIQTEGPLFVAAHRDRRLWTVIQITGDPDDPKRSSRISLEWATQMIKSYGRDNPWVMATVLGRFPKASPLNFIGQELVDQAVASEAIAQMNDPLIIGVDVARFGNDKTVIRFRKGRDARTHPPIKLRNMDNLQVATRVATVAQEMQADAIFVDGGGNGGGVIDILRGVLHVPNVIEVQFGGSPDNIVVDPAGGAVKYANKGTEMYGAMKAWLATGAIDDDPDLKQDLTSRRYAFKMIDGASCIVLEPKDAMKLRGLASPDDGDGLALTFALPVQRHARAGFAGAAAIRGPGNQLQTDYDPHNASPGGIATDYDPFRGG